ncbi:cell adhesion molecule 4 isoform X1 [Erpetoichthys calabaricus]|uniref:cell adhesion molecule 4 isoform X1 n=1 Tax=Erpetoichthys calabaricus TaxID=27687 RepID=UPI0010A05C47|nr:cell adhesion molecule 4 isoform X1 [Erpetoichthys calabaricus]
MAGSWTDFLASVGILFLVINNKVLAQVVQAENVTVIEGGTAEINCKLHNYDGSIVVIQNPARQTLFFNGTRALKDERFQMVLFSPRLVKIALSNVNVKDEGGYFCQLYTDDTHHQVATLTVQVPPAEPTVEVKEQAVEGGEVELTCIVPRSKPPASVRWYRERREIIGVTSQQENDKTVSISNTIRFQVDRKDDKAIVSCEATHPALRGQKRVNNYALNVHYSPKVKIQYPAGVLREGDTLTLMCTTMGNPEPESVEWTRLNDSLPDRTEIQGKALTIPRLSMMDNGTYVCEGENQYGRSVDEYVLVVYEVPIQTEEPTEVSNFSELPKDPGAIVEAQSSVPYAIIGGILAVLVFAVICVLIIIIWCSVRQKGSYLTHEASGLDEHGEVQEAFLNGNENREGKKEYLL